MGSSQRNIQCILGLFQVVVVVVLWLFTEYEHPYGPASAAADHYLYYLNTSVMMFIGFGFLMAFLRLHNYTAIGCTMLVTTVAIEASLVLQVITDRLSGAGPTSITNALLVNGNVTAAVVLISFGALIGRTGIDQMVLLTVLEVPFYFIGLAVHNALGTVDTGGSLKVHVFGAYFGLAASLVLDTEDTPKDEEHPSAGPTEVSNAFSLLGTVFLWLMWPSFNSGLAPVHQRHIIVVNTVLALCSSCVVTFIASHHYNKGKFNVIDIQNATLAGGVAVGTTCNMNLQVGGALVIGAAAGLLSTTGYNVLISKLQLKLGLRDTCGVNNLHGMPGLLAGLSSVVVAAIAQPNQYNGHYSEVFPFGGQWLRQLAATGAALGMGIASGYLCAQIVKLISKAPRVFYTDESDWVTPEPEAKEEHAPLVPKTAGDRWKMVAQAVVKREACTRRQQRLAS